MDSAVAPVKSTNSGTSTLCTSTFTTYQKHHDRHGRKSKSEIKLLLYEEFETDPRKSKPEVLEHSTDENDRRLGEEYEPQMDEVLKLVNSRAGYPCRESDLPKSFDLPPSIQEIVLSLAIAIKEGFGPFGRWGVTAETWIDTMWEEPFAEPLIIDLR
jgi:hypothetical protein